MSDLAGKHIVLGLTGGIACFKSAELCRELIRQGEVYQINLTMRLKAPMSATADPAIPPTAEGLLPDVARDLAHEVEDRLVGIKSREVYEAPAAMTLIAAHRALEDIVLTKAELHVKRGIEDTWAKKVGDGIRATGKPVAL